jgi:glucose-6-phosphate 1-epimerase
VRFASELTVSLSVTNLDMMPFTYEAALHTYLSVEGIAQVHVEGLDGVDFVDKAAGMRRSRQEGPVTFAGLVDRVYASPGPVRVVDSAGARRLAVATSGARQLVVWNPGKDKGAEIPDLAPQEWRRFVCVEAGCVLDEAVELGPGDTHVLATTISVD